MSRLKGILVAGTLTGLVLVTALALGFGRVRAMPAEGTALAQTGDGITSPVTNDLEIGQQLQAWQAYSVKLEQTIQIMQARETQYQLQIDLANQTILQLQDEINRINSARLSPFLEERHSHEFGEFDE